MTRIYREQASRGRHGGSFYKNEWSCYWFGFQVGLVRKIYINPSGAADFVTSRVVGAVWKMPLLLLWNIWNHEQRNGVFCWWPVASVPYGIWNHGDEQFGIRSMTEPRGWKLFMGWGCISKTRFPSQFKFNGNFRSLNMMISRARIEVSTVDTVSGVNARLSWWRHQIRVTGPLCGEFAGHRSNGWINNREAGDLRPSCPLWRHCSVKRMSCPVQVQSWLAHVCGRKFSLLANGSQRRPVSNPDEKNDLRTIQSYHMCKILLRSIHYTEWMQN